MKLINSSTQISQKTLVRLRLSYSLAHETDFVQVDRLQSFLRLAVDMPSYSLLGVVPLRQLIWVIEEKKQHGLAIEFAYRAKADETS